MLPDPYGSDYDYDTIMGRLFHEEWDADADTLYERQQDEQEDAWWAGTESPADDLLEVLRREEAA